MKTLSDCDVDFRVAAKVGIVSDNRLPYNWRGELTTYQFLIKILVADYGPTNVSNQVLYLKAGINHVNFSLICFVNNAIHYEFGSYRHADA